MPSPTNNFLTLIPTAHRVAIISPFTSPIDSATGDESLVTALQKTRRSSSTASEGSSNATLSDIVESPIEAKSPQVEQVGGHQFLKLGN